MRKMARLRYIENARTGDAGSVCTNDSKLFFDDTGAYVYASASGTLALVATTIAITGDLTVSGAATITGTLTGAGTEIPVATTYLGTLTVGVNDSGYDVTFYGATSGKKFLWDESADGVVLTGNFTQTGTLALTGAATVSSTLNVTGATTLAALTSVGAVSLTGAVAINGDTTIETSDRINFYDTGAYIYASASTTLALVGTNITLAGITGITGATTITGTMTLDGNVTLSGSRTFTTGTGAITLSGAIGIGTVTTITPVAIGTHLAFALATAWVSGTLISAAFGSATTVNNHVIGVLLDFATNVTGTTAKDITGFELKLPGLSVANNTSYIGFDLSAAGAITSTANTFTWKGFNVQLPNTTQTGGANNSYGLFVTGGTVTSGTQVGVYVTGTITSGIQLVGSMTNFINIASVGSNAAIGIEFSDGFLGHSISTGTRGNTTDLGVTLTATNEFNAGFFADDSTANIADSVANVLARTVLLATQSGGSIRSVQGQLKIADAVDVGTGVYTAVQGYIELMGDTSVKTGGKMSCMDISLEIASTKTLTIDSGGLFAGLKIETTGAGTFTQTGNSAAIWIDDGGTVTDWKVGIDINNCTTGIDIGSGTTGISMTGAYATAAIAISTTLAAYDDHALSITTSCAATSGDIVPVEIAATMSGAAGVGQALKVTQSVATAALGSYVNAIYGILSLGTTGSVSGLGAPICSEIVFPSGTTSGYGTLAGVEIELTTGAASTMGGTVSALWIQTSGATSTVVDANGYLFTIVGFASGATSFWYDHQGTAPTNVEEWVRVKTPAGDRWLALYNAVV